MLSKQNTVETKSSIKTILPLDPWKKTIREKIFLEENYSQKIFLKEILLGRKSSWKKSSWKKIFSKENRLERNLISKKIFLKENPVERKSSPKKFFSKKSCQKKLKLKLLCIGCRVSVQGVESLWGDWRFIPADWGS